MNFRLYRFPIAIGSRPRQQSPEIKIKVFKDRQPYFIIFTKCTYPNEMTFTEAHWGKREKREKR